MILLSVIQTMFYLKTHYDSLSLIAYVWFIDQKTEITQNEEMNMTALLFFIVIIL